MTRRSTCQENVTIVSVYVPNSRASKYLKYKPPFQQLMELLDQQKKKSVKIHMIQMNGTITHLGLIDITEHYTL